MSKSIEELKESLALAEKRASDWVAQEDEYGETQLGYEYIYDHGECLLRSIEEFEERFTQAARSAEVRLREEEDRLRQEEERQAVQEAVDGALRKVATDDLFKALRVIADVVERALDEIVCTDCNSGQFVVDAGGSRSVEMLRHAGDKLTLRCDRQKIAELVFVCRDVHLGGDWQIDTFSGIGEWEPTSTENPVNLVMELLEKWRERHGLERKSQR